MADRETVIKRLKKCRRCECDDCTEKGASQAPWDCPAYDDFVDSAIALLREQEAKPVKVVKNAYNHEFYYCPRCDRSFYGPWVKPKFCDRCGQAVKWND